MSGEAVLFILLCLFWLWAFNRRPSVPVPNSDLARARARYAIEQRLDDAQRERDER